MGTQIGSFFKSKYTGQQIENMLDSATNIADQYDAASSYVVGDLVLYNNGLYVCTGATSGTFDPAKWQQTTLDEILTNLGATYSDPNNDGNVVVGVDSTTGTKTIKSISFPSLTNKYVFPFAQYIRTNASNDPDNASFDVEIPDAEEAPMHSTVIKGKTVAVNQLVISGNFANAANWNTQACSLSVSNNVAHLTNAVSTNHYMLYTVPVVPLNAAHTYFFTLDAKGNQSAYCSARTASEILFNYTVTTNWQTFASIFTGYGNNSWISPCFRTQANFISGLEIDVRNVNIVDLTTIFSAANLVTIGTSVATFKSLWLKQKGTPLPQYIPYDAGSLANVNGEYRVRGRNLWDEEWEVGSISSTNGTPITDISAIRSKNFIPVNPTKQYYVFCKASISNWCRMRFYDANHNYIGYDGQATENGQFSVPSNCAYMKFCTYANTYGATYNNDICINLSDPSFNGQYEPYYNGGTIDCSTAPLNGTTDSISDEKDFATGKRITRCGVATVTGSTANAGEQSTSWGGWRRVYVNVLEVTASSTDDANAKMVVSGAKINSAALTPTVTQTEAICSAYVGTNNFYILVPNIASSAAMDAYLNANPITVCYPLSAPVTTTETPQPVETQYGYNVFEPISGGVQSAEVDLTYYENIAGYIDKKLAEG